MVTADPKEETGPPDEDTFTSHTAAWFKHYRIVHTHTHTLQRTQLACINKENRIKTSHHQARANSQSLYQKILYKPLKLRS